MFAVDLLGDDGCFSDRELGDVLQPLLDHALLPYVRQRFNCSGAALVSARFRRFVPEERCFVPPHHEHGAFAVLAVGLQDPQALTGGLFVQGSGRAFLDRRFVPLGRGDVCAFQHDLHHGVEVQEGSRSELLFFFKDAAQSVTKGTSPWYQQLAEAGNASAQYGLSLSLFHERDYAGAQSWLQKACSQDHPEALYTQAIWDWEPPAGITTQADTARALQLLRRAAELGHARSQSRLGGLLTQGVKGRVQQDSWEGKRLLRLAFEQDDPDAAFHLGQTLLQEGDRDGATKLLAACVKGHPRACFQVAEMYREGQYQFVKDQAKAIRYTKWAAHMGDPQAMSNLGHLLINGMGVVRDDAKAVRLFRHSARLGAAEGQLNYGLALLRGNGGVRVDYQEALEWAQKSAAQGHSLAHQQLSMFFNASKNPNPPARSKPASREELARLSLRELRELLKSEGIDFSDCVEKADLVARAALRLPGVAEPWDAAPENTLLLEPPKKMRAELLKQRQHMQEQQQQQQQTTAPSSQEIAGATTAATSSGVTTNAEQSKGAANATATAADLQPEGFPPTAPAQGSRPVATPAASSSGCPPTAGAAGNVAAQAQASKTMPPVTTLKDEEFEFID
jgi:TPR repeat protein